jgi:hypothetical protein
MIALRIAALGLILSLAAVASADTVQPLHPMITFLPPGQINHPYLAKNLIAGGVAPYVVAQLDGALPRGMAISSAGALYGTPRVTGTFRFKIDFKDSAETPAALTLSYTLQVEASHPPPRNTLLGPTGS